MCNVIPCFACIPSLVRTNGRLSTWDWEQQLWDSDQQPPVVLILKSSSLSFIFYLVISLSRTYSLSRFKSSWLI